MTKRVLIIFSWMVLLFPGLLTSCGQDKQLQTESERPKVNEIKREYRKGPLCARLSVDKDSISIAESVVLTIEAEIEDGFEAELPKFGEKLGVFGIKDYRDDPPRLTPEGKIVSKKVYTLDPFLSGDYTISPLVVKFRKKAEAGSENGGGSDAGGVEEHEISTEEITIKVTSLFEKDQQELALNPIKGPVDLPRGPVSYLYIFLGLGAAGIIVAGGVFVFFRHRRAAKRRKPAPLMPPHELAYRQLQEILDEELIERREIKLFFLKVSDVLRSYIENRFGIHAPRRTTEEFLSTISHDAPFSAEQQRLLSEFLVNCDLVKFAEHFPAQEEVARALDSCRDFIDATREDASQFLREGNDAL